MLFSSIDRLLECRSDDSNMIKIIFDTDQAIRIACYGNKIIIRHDALFRPLTCAVFKW